MKRIIRSIRPRDWVVIVVLYGTLFAACGVNIYSDKDDVALGQQLDEEIKSNPQQYPILRDRPVVKSYVVGIVNKILQSPAIEKRNIYPYNVEIIADDETINAFCTPGGYIYVYTGLIKFLPNEAALAGILGHEIAHAERRHATKRITAAYGVQILLGAALGQNPSTVEQIAANLFTNLGFLKNSRDDELESDNYSMKYLRSTEYYPGGIIFFFERINQAGKGTASELEKLFLTHPPSQERYDNVQKTMQEWGIPQPTQKNLFPDRYGDFKAKLP
ncbi:MAG: peptidase M48 [Ectothiorhodospiraceae bacterium]|nr:peptidase M48 [Ectothiorhodospiraceae bacterium]